MFPAAKKISISQQEKEQRKMSQIDMCDKIRTYSMQIMDTLLAIVEVF